MIQGVIEILTDSTEVQALVGRNAGDTKWKVYPVRAPQEEKAPYIVVFKIPVVSPTISKNEQSSLDICKFRVIAYVKNYVDRDSATEIIRVTLDNKTSTTDNGIVFDRIWYETDSDGYDDDAKSYAAIIEFGSLVKRTIMT